MRGGAAWSSKVIESFWPSHCSSLSLSYTLISLSRITVRRRCSLAFEANWIFCLLPSHHPDILRKHFKICTRMNGILKKSAKRYLCSMCYLQSRTAAYSRYWMRVKWTRSLQYRELEKQTIQLGSYLGRKQNYVRRISCCLMSIRLNALIKQHDKSQYIMLDRANVTVSRTFS